MKKCVLVLIPALLAASAARGDEGPKDNRLPALRTQAVTGGTVTVAVRASGTLEPGEVIDVGRQVAGRIDRFGPDPDDGTRRAPGRARLQDARLRPGKSDPSTCACATTTGPRQT
jgi:HlyD family secretion protein